MRKTLPAPRYRRTWSRGICYLYFSIGTVNAPGACTAGVRGKFNIRSSSFPSRRQTMHCTNSILVWWSSGFILTTTVIFPISSSQARWRIWKRDVHFPTIGFEPLVEEFILCNFSSQFSIKNFMSMTGRKRGRIVWELWAVVCHVSKSCPYLGAWHVSFITLFHFVLSFTMNSCENFPRFWLCTLVFSGYFYFPLFLYSICIIFLWLLSAGGQS